MRTEGVPVTTELGAMMVDSEVTTVKMVSVAIGVHTEATAAMLISFFLGQVWHGTRWTKQVPRAG